jgi:hypothetical protein
VQDREPYLSNELRERLRAPVDFGAGARARVMQRVRAAAAPVRLSIEPRGMVRPSVLGALLAASFVAAVVTGGARQGSAGGAQATLADTIAMQFDSAAAMISSAPVIVRERLVAVADETRNLVPPQTAAPRAVKTLRFD